MSEDIDDLEVMASSDDPEEREMAEEELTNLRSGREGLWDELLEMTIGGEDANPQSVCDGNPSGYWW